MVKVTIYFKPKWKKDVRECASGTLSVEQGVSVLKLVYDMPPGKTKQTVIPLDSMFLFDLEGEELVSEKTRIQPDNKEDW